MLADRTPKKARAAAPALYARLYRYDRFWLKQVNQAQPRTQVLKRKPRVDWRQRDRHYLTKLREILRFLRAARRGPRHSQTYLLKQLGKLSTLEKKLDRLPRTRRLLARYTESVPEYQVRRLRNAWWELKQEFHYPPRWRLIRLAGLSETRLTDQARDYLHGLEENQEDTNDQGNQDNSQVKEIGSMVRDLRTSNWYIEVKLDPAQEKEKFGVSQLGLIPRRRVLNVTKAGAPRLPVMKRT